MNVARLARFSVYPPEHRAAFGISDRRNPRKVAGFTTDPHMRVVRHFLIVPVMAGQAAGTFLSGMSKLGRLRMAGKTRLRSMRGGAVCLNIYYRQGRRSRSLTISVAFEAERGNLPDSVLICGLNPAMASHAIFIGWGQCRQCSPCSMADAALAFDRLRVVKAE